VAADQLAEVCSVDSSQVEDVLRQIAEEFDARGSGFDLREREGLWRLYTRPENSDVVEAKSLQGTPQRLSRAALGALAGVACRQPVSRARVAPVRGVTRDGVMRTLALCCLIRQVELAAEGEEETSAVGPGGAHLYETTVLFLEQLGIESLDVLPDLA